MRYFFCSEKKFQAKLIFTGVPILLFFELGGEKLEEVNSIRD